MFLKKPLFIYFIFLIIFVLILIAISYILKINLTSLSILYMLTPFLATVITSILMGIPFIELGISFNFNRWFLLALFLPFFIVFATLFISLFFPGVKYTSEMKGLLAYGIKEEIIAKKYEEYSRFGFSPLIFISFLSLIVGPTINTIFAFGEEIGWRGLLYRELKNLGFWKYSFFSGIIWGIWHFPLIFHGHNYPKHPFLGSFMMIIFTALLSPLINFIRIKSKSVIACSIFHGMINALASISIAFVIGNNLIIGMQGLSGIIIIFLLDIFLYTFLKLNFTKI